jgi:hypothetical protein
MQSIGINSYYQDDTSPDWPDCFWHRLGLSLKITQLIWRWKRLNIIFAAAFRRNLQEERPEFKQNLELFSKSRGDYVD